MSDTFLSSGQSLNTVTIGDGDSVYVGYGASTSDLQLAPDGNEYVMAGGQALGTVVSAGGFLFAAGGTDAASAIVSGGTIDAGAEAILHAPSLRAVELYENEQAPVSACL